MTARQMPASQELIRTRLVAPPAPSAWLLHPAIDLMFCCGGLVWLLVALHVLLGWSPAHERSLAGTASGSLISLIGVLLLSDTHNAATLVRLYGDRQIRTSARSIAYGAPLVLAAIAAASMIWTSLLGVVLLAYTVFIAQHFTAQAYGIALIYCNKRGYRLNSADRKILQVLLQATMVFAIVRQFAEPGFRSAKIIGISPPVLEMLPDWLLYASLGGVVAAALVFAYLVVIKALRERSYLPLPALLLVATSVAIFTVSKDIFGLLWIYVPAFFHGSQYLVVTTSCHLKHLCRERNLPASKAATLIFTRENLEYWGLLLFIGIGLYIGVPALLNKLGIPFAIAFAAVFSAVNLHHFLADHTIWRMRDPKIRQILVA